MGSKYMIYCFNYPYKGYTEKTYQSQTFIKFVRYLIIAIIKYDGININIRKPFKTIKEDIK